MAAMRAEQTGVLRLGVWHREKPRGGAASEAIVFHFFFCFFLFSCSFQPCEADVYGMVLVKLFSFFFFFYSGLQALEEPQVPRSCSGFY